MGTDPERHLALPAQPRCPMIINSQSAPRMILALALCLGLAGCESEKSRRAAFQFAYSWELTVMGGFIYVSDAGKMEQFFRENDPVREVMKEEGSPAMWREAQQLDTLILYVARCLDANIQAHLARLEEPAAGPPIPVEFPDVALNRLLGLDASAGENPKKALLALHEAITRFAEAVGVGKQFKDEIGRKAQKIAEQDSPAAKRLAGLSWPEIVEGRMTMARARKTVRERIAK